LLATKECWKNVLAILESPGKVFKFFESDKVETVYNSVIVI